MNIRRLSITEAYQLAVAVGDALDEARGRRRARVLNSLVEPLGDALDVEGGSARAGDVDDGKACSSSSS